MIEVLDCKFLRQTKVKSGFPISDPIHVIAVRSAWIGTKFAGNGAKLAGVAAEGVGRLIVEAEVLTKMAGTEYMNLKWMKLEKKMGTLDFPSFILITAREGL